MTLSDEMEECEEQRKIREPVDAGCWEWVDVDYNDLLTALKFKGEPVLPSGRRAVGQCRECPCQSFCLTSRQRMQRSIQDAKKDVKKAKTWKEAEKAKAILALMRSLLPEDKAEGGEAKQVNVNDLLKQAALEGVINCPICNALLEPDVKECGECGWENILITEGYI